MACTPRPWLLAVGAGAGQGLSLPWWHTAHREASGQTCHYPHNAAAPPTGPLLALGSLSLLHPPHPTLPTCPWVYRSVPWDVKFLPSTNQAPARFKRLSLGLLGSLVVQTMGTLPIACPCPLFGAASGEIHVSGVSRHRGGDPPPCEARGSSPSSVPALGQFRQRRFPVSKDHAKNKSKNCEGMSIVPLYVMHVHLIPASQAEVEQTDSGPLPAPPRAAGCLPLETSRGRLPAPFQSFLDASDLFWVCPGKVVKRDPAALQACLAQHRAEEGRCLSSRLVG